MPVWSNTATGRTWLSFVPARLPQSGKGRSAWVGCEKHLGHYPHRSRLPLIKLQLSPKLSGSKKKVWGQSLAAQKEGNYTVCIFMLCCNPAIYSYLVEWCLVSYVFCFMSVSVCQKVPLLWQDHGPQPHPPGEQGSGGRGLIWAISCKQRYSWTTLYFNTVPVISSNLHKNECTMPLQGEQDLSHIPRG